VRGWDPAGVAAKLELAMESLQKARIEVQSKWDDQTSHAFDERFLAPLAAKLNRAKEVIRHLDEVLRKAEQECS